LLSRYDEALQTHTRGRNHDNDGILTNNVTNESAWGSSASAMERSKDGVLSSDSLDEDENEDGETKCTDEREEEHEENEEEEEEEDGAGIDRFHESRGAEHVKPLDTSHNDKSRGDNNDEDEDDESIESDDDGGHEEEDVANVFENAVNDRFMRFMTIKDRVTHRLTRLSKGKKDATKRRERYLMSTPHVIAYSLKK
jgi:hypothetical protein